MITIQFLAEWALRSSLLILSGALLLRALRVKDPSIRLAAWTAMLCGSLAIPAITSVAPKLALPVVRTVARPARASQVVYQAAKAPASEVSGQPTGVASPFAWARAALMIYGIVAGALLVRLGAGLAMHLHLLRGSRSTGQLAEGIEIRESNSLSAPVALGIARCAIVLPVDWRQWDRAKLDAVLAHERSHILRCDPLVQLISAIHRALMWHSPLSWFLHRCIVRVAEEASDDAAVAVIRDRASYAEVLLEFMQRGVRVASWQGVAMARYSRPEERIHRILDGTGLSAGVTRWSVAAILALGSPLAYLAAAARPQTQPQAQFVQDVAIAPVAATATTVAIAAPQTAPASPVQPAAPQRSEGIRRYLIVLDNFTSESGDARNAADEAGLRAKFGRNFAWFRQSGNEFVVTDAGVIAELKAAMEPQREVNRMQSEVNVAQAKVNVLQARVVSQQNEVSALQLAVSQRQDLVNQIQTSANKDETEALIQKLQMAIRELRTAKDAANQEAVNSKQVEINEAQARVNQEQSKVNALQQKVNAAQARASAEYNRRIEEILDSAVRRRLAQQLM